MNEAVDAANAAKSATFQTCLRFVINGFGWIGGAFIAYGIVSAATKEPWPPVERFAELVSSALAVVGTLIKRLFQLIFSTLTRTHQKE
jgi:hypothetical protein